MAGSVCQVQSVKMTDPRESVKITSWSTAPPGGIRPAPGDGTARPTDRLVAAPWLVRSRRRRRGGQIRLAPPAWLDLEERLRSIILTIRQTSRSPAGSPGCNPRYWKVACSCGFSVVRSGCGRADCPTCAPTVRRRRAERARARLESVRRGRPLIYTIFTLPPELRPEFADPNAFRLLVRRVWKLLKTNYGGDFALSAAHPVGDPREPGQDPDLFHPHINFVWLQKKGNGFLDVARLRADFAALLGTAGPVDLRNRYTYKRGEIWHVISYTCRPFPGFSSWTGPVRWLGSYPRKTAAERLEEKQRSGICPECGGPRLFIGRADLEDWIAYMARRSSERLAADLAKHAARAGPPAGSCQAEKISWNDPASWRHLA